MARPRRAKPALPNLKATPIQGRTITGEAVTLDGLSGRYHLMVKRSGWPRELAEACLRFEHDWQLSRGSIRGQTWEPRVDGGKPPEGFSRLDAAGRVRRIEAAMDAEEYLVLILWAGFGMTISEIKARGWGQKDEIGRVLQRAAARAASVYHAGYVAPMSDRLISMQRFIEEQSRG